LRKIAITGGLAAGKSTVCRILKEYGAYVIDADEVVHDLLSPQTTVGKQVIELLGSAIIVGNQIDKKKISEIVFSNSEKLKSLEAILHPTVKKEIDLHYQKVKKNKSFKCFVAEIPLLYEASMDKDFDTVIAVVAEPAIARARFSSPSEFNRRAAEQLPPQIKAEKADFVIYNNGDIKTLQYQVKQIIDSIV